MEHAKSSRGKTQVEMLASFSQQCAEEKEKEAFYFYLKDLHNLHFIANYQQFVYDLQTCGI